MKTKFTSTILLLLLSFVAPALPPFLKAVSADSQDAGSTVDALEKTAADGFYDPLLNCHTYLKNGLFIESPEKNIVVKLGTKIGFDTGYIAADQDLNGAFPDLGGFDYRFRRLRAYTQATFWDTVEFKFEIDFANTTAIKDVWVRYMGNPSVGEFTLGYMKEPFSLEELTSSSAVTFMERSLPTSGFAPSRDIGLVYSDVKRDKRLTWSAGAFWIVGSFGNVGEGEEALTNSSGTALTGRLTGLLWYEGKGENLLHLGLSYSHQFRNEDSRNDGLEIKVRPETYLTDDRLVDTGKFFTGDTDFVDPEMALVVGPFSLQGEYFHLFASSKEADNPGFWGFYCQGSFFITGEHRPYDATKGLFSGIRPHRNFSFTHSGWGAWEAALRLSFIDLDGGAIHGGRETDVTVGLNWYLNPHMRFLFNYVRAHVEDREYAPEISDGNADILQARFQVHF